MSFKNFLAPLFVLFTVIAVAQKKQPDSLKNNTIGELVTLIKYSEPGEDAIHKQALLDFPIKNIIKARELMKIGNFFYQEKEYERSVQYMDEAISFLQDPMYKTFLSNVYFIKGNAYLKNWQNQSALDAYYQSLDISKNNPKQNNKDIKRDLLATINISIIRRRMNQLQEALAIGKTTLNLINKSEERNVANHIKITNIISKTYLELKEYDSVLYYSNLGIKLNESINYTEKEELAISYTGKGTGYCHKGNHDKALHYFSEAATVFYKNDNKDKTHLINAIYYHAACFYEQNLYRKTIEKLGEMMPLIEENDLNIQVVKAYLLFAKANKAIGEGKEAAHWYEKYTVLNTKFNNDKDRTIDKLYKKEEENLGEQIQNLIKDQKRRKLYTLYSRIALFLISSILIVMLILYLKKQKSNSITFKKLIEKINHLESQAAIDKVNTTVAKEVIINDEKVAEIIKKLDKLEQEAFFLSLDCNLRAMAKKVHTNATYLSRIINTYKEKNFNDYINDLRIDYALKRLKNDKTFRLFSVKSIATEIGYKSDYSFAKHFKIKTGLNPSYYIKKINELEQSNTLDPNG